MPFVLLLLRQLTIELSASIEYFVAARFSKYTQIPQNLENINVEENKHESCSSSTTASLFYILRHRFALDKRNGNNSFRRKEAPNRMKISHCIKIFSGFFQEFDHISDRIWPKWDFKPQWFFHVNSKCLQWNKVA